MTACSSHFTGIHLFYFLNGKSNRSRLKLVCVGVSWLSSLVHRTQVLVLSENQNVGSIPGSGTCVLEQDT